MCVRVRACERVCVSVYVCACVRACVHSCVPTCIRACVSDIRSDTTDTSGYLICSAYLYMVPIYSGYICSGRSEKVPNSFTRPQQQTNKKAGRGERGGREGRGRLLMIN